MTQFPTRNIHIAQESQDLFRLIMRLKKGHKNDLKNYTSLVTSTTHVHADGRCSMMIRVLWDDDLTNGDLL